MNRYTNEQLAQYASALAKVASLSNLFSESSTPFIHYRATEYLYARAFEARNLARSDIAIDAKLGTVGVGLKTFVYSNRPKYEKIAEFNRDQPSFNSLRPLDKIRRIAELRNERIRVAGEIASVQTFVYHCIARSPRALSVFEQEMPYINLDDIEIQNSNSGTISFSDGRESYRFNQSKSTLFKEFFTQTYLVEQPVNILRDPFEVLDSLNLVVEPASFGRLDVEQTPQESVVLPLYSTRGKPSVEEKSGLNQWNASGRVRHIDEVYIPVPAVIHQKYPGFFPPRSVPFDVHFPNGSTLSMSLCQGKSHGKALMSNPNNTLGSWLLRDVLHLAEGELATYSLLEKIGIDSVEVSKMDDQYYIDFKQLGSYEQFVSD
ncbi:MAG: hypothetical protein FWG08_01670 [Propionibacteriaceae bacterium]|nr:hypothetical protein [Propionibacteriaceae bacterium]